MRKLYFLLAGLLLAAPAARAQQPWQPFRPGLSYQYHEAATAGDTTHVLRLRAGAPAAGSATDSLYAFTARVGRALPAGFCSKLPRLLPDNLFGATLRSQPRAVFVLAAANGRTLTLRPRAPLGQSWPTGLPGLAASVTARAVGPVLNAGLADSLATITLSDGRTLRLSKSYGLLEGPSLDSYLNGRNARRALTLSALPERGLGTALTGPHASYDFAPGDVFQRVREITAVNFGGGVCEKTWMQDSVISRQLSRTGDSLTYTLRTWQVYRSYGVAGAPAGFCSVPASTSTSVTTRKLVVSTSKDALGALTSYYVPADGSTNPQLNRYTSALVRGSRLGGVYEYRSDLRYYRCAGTPADSLAFDYLPDTGNTSRYSPGLGQTFVGYYGIYFRDETSLTAYQKGSTTWGTFFTRRTLLAARDVQPAPTTTAVPNPFADELTVAFVLSSPQPVGATLYDALGRVVRAVPPAPQAAGSRQLRLPTADLPAGLYTLHLTFAATGRREVLRVAK